MSNITVFAPSRIIGFSLPDDAGHIIDQAFIQGGSVIIRLDGQNTTAEVVGDIDPKRHAWGWNYRTDGTPGPVECSHCGALAAFDGVDTNCEPVGPYRCPPTVFDPSDHVSACPLYQAHPCKVGP